jgi:hypothetical protein
VVEGGVEVGCVVWITWWNCSHRTDTRIDIFSGHCRWTSRSIFFASHVVDHNAKGYIVLREIR